MYKVFLCCLVLLLPTCLCGQNGSLTTPGWFLQDSSKVDGDGAALSQVGYNSPNSTPRVRVSHSAPPALT